MRWGWEIRSKESQMCFKPDVRPQCHRNYLVTITARAMAQLKVSYRGEGGRLRLIRFCPSPVMIVTDLIV